MDLFHAVIYLFFLSSLYTSAYGVVRCPKISNLGDVIASGNTEKATHGDVIHFECDSPKILNGPKDIHCQDNGQWSGPIPKCTGVICLPPEILHGFSDPNKVYKENNILQYGCDSGYTPRHGNSWCTKSGWSIKPECEEMICLLGALTPGNASTNPKGKNIFKVGEVVEITCSNSPWLFERTHEARKIKCQTNGKWEVSPGCEEAICEYPRGERLLYPTEPNHRMLYTLKESIQYQCELGYNATAANITCTENDWDPKPLCTGNKCLPPEIPHGFTNPATEYDENNILQYRCEPGYKPKAEYSRCTKYGWSILPECEEMTCLLGPLTLARTNPSGKNIFKVGENVTITCEKNYFVVWTKQVSRTIKCQDDGKWESKLVCEEIICEYPYGEHLAYPPEPYFRKRYKLHEKIQYHCDYGYKGTATSATCTENGWEPKPLCTEIICEYPYGEHLAYPPEPYFRKRYKLHEKIQYHCDYGYKGTATSATCTENGWEPKPLCTALSVCGPPPYVEFAALATFQKSFYNFGERVEYRCQQLYTIDGDNSKTCVQGTWTGSVRCLKPCIVTIEDMNGNEITNLYGEKRVLYAMHKDHMTFKCQYGRYQARNSVAFRQQCINGVMHLPTCQ